MVNALVSESWAGWGHCVVFLAKTEHSHSASIHPGVYIDTGELLGQPDKNAEGYHPIQDSSDTPSRRF